MSNTPAKRSRAKKAAAVPASIAGLTSEVGVKTPKVPRKKAVKATKPKIEKMPWVPSVPKNLRNQVLDAKIVVLPGGTMWDQDMFIKVKGSVYYLGSISTRRHKNGFSMFGDSSVLERAAYSKLIGKPASQLEELVKSEKIRNAAKKEVAQLEAIKNEAGALGYALVKAPTPIPPPKAVKRVRKVPAKKVAKRAPFKSTAKHRTNMPLPAAPLI